MHSPIGTGGMGRVYRARIEGPAGAAKRVAVKVMHGHLADDADFVEMFLDEMRVAMALDHRNIVQTFDADHSDGSYFMVMELVEGCSLRQLLGALGRRGKALPVDIAVFIGMEISAALDFAHRPSPETRSAGVLHRDVSPSNILLAAEGSVKLADFGVAKAAGGHFVTSANLIRGKLQYMSPEQARGEACRQSDLYSLGAVLYEITTGRPIPRPSAFEGLKNATLPSAPRLLRAEIPDALSSLILRCLEPEVSARVGSATELRSALAAVSFELQRRPGMHVDPHERLRTFLQENGPSQLPTADAAAKREADQLAAAVLQQVRALETDTGFDAETLTFEKNVKDPPAEPLAEVAPPHREPQTRKARAPVELEAARPARQLEQVSPPPRQGLGGALAIMGVAVLAAFAVLLYVVSTKRVEPGALPSDDGPTLRLERHDATPLAVRRDLAHAAPRPSVPHDAGVDHKARSHRRRGVAFGYLDINSVPWTRVYIDGRLRGETPLQRLRLSAGWHQLRLTSPKRGASWRYRVQVKAHHRTSRVFKLPRK